MSAYHHNCEMKALTSQQFNEAIGQFKDVLFDNLQCMIRFKAVAASVKQVNEENYLFGCIAVEDEVRLEFTISYDEFYQVPVFCFRIYVNDRLNFDVVELDTSLKELSHLAMNKIVDISIIDHHLLHQPWFQIHPCEISQSLHTHMSSQDSTTKDCNYNPFVTYLTCWFGLYGLPAIFPQFSIRPVVYS